MIIKYKHTNIYTEIYTKCSFLIFQNLILTSDFLKKCAMRKCKNRLAWTIQYMYLNNHKLTGAFLWTNCGSSSSVKSFPSSKHFFWILHLSSVLSRGVSFPVLIASRVAEIKSASNSPSWRLVQSEKSRSIMHAYYCDRQRFWSIQDRVAVEFEN